MATLAELAMREDLRFELPETLSLESGMALEWGSYLQIEKALDEILSNASQPVEVCLCAGYVWLAMLGKTLEVLQLAGRGARDHGENGSGKIAEPEAVEAYINSTRKNGFERSFSIASRSAGHASVKRMVLGTFIAFRGMLGPRQPQLVQMIRVFFENLRHWVRIGSLRFPPLQARVPYGIFRPSLNDLSDGESQDLLRRYVRHSLFRKSLVAQSDLISGYRFLILTHGVIQWHAAALRATGKPNTAQALAMVEERFSFTPDFDPSFLDHPAIGHIMYHLFRKANFAHIILGD